MRKSIGSSTLSKRFPIDGIPALEAGLAAGRGSLVVTMHLGNWELLGVAGAAALGHFSAFARPVGNQLIDDYLARLRQSAGISLIDTGGGVRPILAALRKGNAISIMIDQQVRAAFVRTMFFGRDVTTTAIVATLALRTGIPVFCAYSVRDGYSFRHHGYVEGPIQLIRTGDRDADVLSNTQALNDKLEAIIRRYPHQWLWTYPRWRMADKIEREQQESGGLAREAQFLPISNPNPNPNRNPNPASQSRL